jgi:iron complex transport system ATP-binding protein
MIVESLHRPRCQSLHRDCRTFLREELPASTTHALQLRAGRVLAAGPVDEVLTSELASARFDHPIAITRHAGRWVAASFR